MDKKKKFKRILSLFLVLSIVLWHLPVQYLYADEIVIDETIYTEIVEDGATEDVVQSVTTEEAVEEGTTEEVVEDGTTEVVVEEGTTEDANNMKFEEVFATAPRIAGDFTVKDPNGTVISTNVPTLQDAINLCDPVTPGQYIIELNNDISSTTKADILGGKDILIKSVDGNAYTYSITGTERHFVVDGSTLALENVNITGKGRGNGVGGGLDITNASTLNVLGNVNITGNTAEFGGGVHIHEGSKFNMTGGSISGNTAEGTASKGGAGYITTGSETNLTNVTFNDNEAGQHGGAFAIRNTGTVANINNVTVTNNYAINGNGGGFDIFDEATVTITDAVITGNTGNIGGGVLNSGATLTITGGEISNNTATIRGGGLGLGTSTVTIEGTAIKNNTSATIGGGIFLASGMTININNAAIDSNTSTTAGGGIHSADATNTINITGTTSISNNISEDNGGAIFISSGTLNISGNATIDSNEAKVSGGGIFGTESVVIDIEGATISNNTAVNYGGGITSSVETSTSINNTTITGNNAQHGGGLAVVNGRNIAVTMTITNSDISNNTATGLGGGFFASGLETAVSISDTTISNNQTTSNGGGGIIYNNATSNITSTTITENSANNGGGLYLLGPLGTAANITNSEVSNNISTLNGGGLYLSNDTSLVAEAVNIIGNSAGKSGGGVASYENTTTTINNSTIKGNIAEVAGGGIYGYATNGAASTATINLTGTNIESNVATTSAGGGIYGYGPKININDNTTITLNDATGSGAGIFMSGAGVFTIKNASITDNTSDNLGGGIGLYAESTATVTGTTITGNSARIGGGIGLQNSATPGVEITIGDSNISNNTVTENGGGIYADNGTIATLTNTTVTGNSSTNDGGGIWVFDYSQTNPVDAATTYQNLTITGGDISGNTSRLTFAPPENSGDYANFNGLLLDNDNIVYNLPEWIAYNKNDLGIDSEQIAYSAPFGTDHEIFDQVGLFTEDVTEFIGWNTMADGSGDFYFPGDTFTMPSENVTLYAIKGYVITYHPNNGVATDMPVTSYFIIDKDYVIENNSFVNGNYTFKGWSSEMTGDIINLYNEADIATFTENTNLYARWITKVTYIDGGEEIVVEVDAGDTHKPGDVTFPNEKGDEVEFVDEDGNVYTKDDLIDLENGDKTFTVVWKNKVTYHSNNDSGDFNEISTNVEENHTIDTNTYVNGNNTFKGWSTEATGEIINLYSEGDLLTLTGNLDLYARWAAKVVYIDGGEEIEVEVDVDNPHEVDDSVLSNPDDRDPVEFVDEDGNVYKPGDLVDIDDDIKLTVVWSKQVTYLINAGNLDDSEISNVSGSAIHIVENDVFVIDGYELTGWNTKPDGTGISYEPGIDITVLEDIVLYAMWEKVDKEDNDDDDDYNNNFNDDLEPNPVEPVEPEPAEPIEPDDSNGLLEKTAHILYLYGYEDGSVRPRNSITRAETSAIIYRLLVDKGVATTNIFKDVDADAWYSNEVNYLVELGILNGYEDGTFKPNEPITRAEFATILARLEELNLSKPHSFDDVSVNHWANDYIVSATNNGWIYGYEDGSFRPENNITRSEAVAMVNRMLNRYPDEQTLETLENPFFDLDEEYWAYGDIIEASIRHSYHREDDGEEIWD